MNTKSVSVTACNSNPGAWIPPMLWGVGAGLTAGVDTALYALCRMPAPLRIGLAAVPLVLSLGYVNCVVGIFRRADELQRRIQLESLGVAFPATAILIMTVDLLEKAKILPAIDWGWSPLVTSMCLLWLGGYAIASRRYR